MYKKYKTMSSEHKNIDLQTEVPIKQIKQLKTLRHIHVIH